MKKNRLDYIAPRIDELDFQMESCCLTSSVTWDGSVGVEGDYEQTEGEW